jgi:excisionase family DNA binding protein
MMLNNLMSVQTSYTPVQVAKMLGVKPTTVYAWLSRKEMRANKVGHNRYISHQQIVDFFNQRKTGEYVDMTYANGPVRS